MESHGGPVPDSLTEPLLEDEDGRQITAVDGDWGPVSQDSFKGTDVVTSPEVEANDNRRKIYITVATFTVITAFFAILAGISRNVEQDTTCYACPVVGTTASNVSQLLLPFVYAAALLSSWYIEKPRRELKQFIIDNLKQVISGAVTHFEATGAAIYLNELVSHIEACDWYLVLFMMDTAYGCFLTVTVHAATVRLSKRYKWSEPLSRLGDYKKKPNPDGTREPSTKNEQIWKWVAQTLHWTVVAVLMRGVVILFVWAFHQSLGDTSIYLGKWACDKEKVRIKTFLNIVFFPVIFDAVQVSIQSFALKPSAKFVESEKQRHKLKKEALKRVELDMKNSTTAM